MKKKYVIPVMALMTISGLSFTHFTAVEFSQLEYVKNHKNSNGSPAGRTGAPGEQTCTACHSGTVQNGSAIQTLELRDPSGNVVTSYLPGVTYDVNFKVNNAAPKKGFQLVALAVNGNTQAGSMVATSNTSVLSSGSKKYVNHKSSSTNTTTGWDFKWTAPATNVGDVKFYVASNVTNSNNNDSGDQIYTSQHTITYNAAASVEEVESVNQFNAFFAATTNTLNLTFNSKIVGEGHLNVVDMSGKSVYNTKIGAVKSGNNTQKVLIPSEIQSGIYLVHLFVNNESAVVKIMIQK